MPSPRTYPPFAALALLALLLPLAQAQRIERAVKAAPAAAPAVQSAPRSKGGDRGTVVERPAVGAVKVEPAAPVAGAPAAGAGKIDVSQLRAVAKQVVTMERIHRERAARMDRLVELFNAKGEVDKVKEIEGLRAKEQNRYSAAMEGYKKAVGPEVFAKIQAAMVASTGKAPPASGTPAPDAGPGRKR